MAARKAQMFVVTAVFLSAMLFSLQQALVAYNTIDIAAPFNAKDVYVAKNVVDAINATIRSGGSDLGDCMRFQRNVEELIATLKEDVTSEGFVMIVNFDVYCENWGESYPGPAPFRMSMRLSETYDATGIMNFYHVQ